jgi:hypothetical protein
MKKQGRRATPRAPSPFLLESPLYPVLSKKTMRLDVQELDVLKLSKKYQVPAGIIRVKLKKINADSRTRFPLVAKAQAK